MASPTARNDDDARKGNDHDDRDVPRYWNAYELQAVCALACKGAHLKGSLSFATKLNTTLNGSGSYENDIDIEDIEELLGKIEKNKKAALAFIERQGTSRITRTQRRVFERNLGFDGTLAEWEGGRREKVMQARQARQAALDEKAKGSHYTVTDGTRIDRWTPSMRTETGQTANQVMETGNSEKQAINTNTQGNNALLTRDIASQSGVAWGAMGPATSPGVDTPLAFGSAAAKRQYGHSLRILLWRASKMPRPALGRTGLCEKKLMPNGLPDIRNPAK
ncbi:uncharacterized protein PG986_013235 [Apiospora aurea]|uniref:Uncharacterized protein n=1 Tax=Apiospora aurea TaxID=335848 RepID=A0ABR1PV05_9PEZI